MTAAIYRRKNGTWGSSCDGCLDTGHHILKVGGNFLVHSIHDEDRRIASNATREEAEKAIAADWRGGAA